MTKQKKKIQITPLNIYKFEGSICKTFHVLITFLLCELLTTNFKKRT